MSIFAWILCAVAVVVWTTGLLRVRSAIHDRLSREEELTAMHESIAFAWSEKRLLEIMERFPRSSTPAVVYAQHAHRRREWDESLRRYQVAIKRNPKDPRGYAGAAGALRGMGRLDESDALLRQADKRCPKRAEVQQEFAWNAIARKDWEEAARRWELHRQFNPDDRMAYEQGQKALRQLGRSEEADALAAEQKARFRDRIAAEATSS